MGKESKKGVDICICITDSLYCTLETNTMMQTNYTTIKIKKKNCGIFSKVSGSKQV